MDCGSRRSATARVTMSRSVTIPLRRPSSTTGTEPMFWPFITSAASASDCDGDTLFTVAVMASRTLFSIAPPSLHLTLSLWRSGVRKLLPVLDAPLDERRPLGGGVAFQYGSVTRVSTYVDPGGARIDAVAALRARRPVAVCAVHALELDLAGPLELGSIRIAGTFAPPEVEDAGRIDAFLRRLAPVARGQRAVGLP